MKLPAVLRVEVERDNRLGMNEPIVFHIYTMRADGSGLTKLSTSSIGRDLGKVEPELAFDVTAVLMVRPGFNFPAPRVF